MTPTPSYLASCRVLLHSKTQVSHLMGWTGHVVPRGRLDMRKSILMCATLAVVSVSSVAADNPPLREVKSINDGLFVVGLADQIRKNCPEISARVFRALGALQDLHSQALAMGYTKSEIDAHIDSDAEKDLLRARAADYMAARGLTPDPMGYCALGRAEIERNSAVGALLRE